MLTIIDVLRNAEMNLKTYAKNNIKAFFALGLEQIVNAVTLLERQHSQYDEFDINEAEQFKGKD